MVEDEDGKIRRNLVAVSTAILLLAWLDVPIAAVAGRVLGEKPDASQYVLSPFRVWLATAALLLYFILRYRFSGEASAAGATLGSSQRTWYGKIFQRHLASLSKKATAGKLPAGAFRKDVEQLVQRQAADLARRTGLQDVRPNVTISLQNGPEPDRGLEQYLSVYSEWRGPGGGAPQFATAGGQSYLMSTTASRGMHLSAWVCAAVYSEGSMALIWPAGLAMAASGVVGWKLIRLLIGI